MIPKRLKLFLLCAIIVVVRVALSFDGVSLSLDYYDEGVYLRDSELVAAGARPYVDFALLHPPVAIYVNALIFALGGSIWTVKAASLLIIIAIDLLAVWLVYRFSKSIFAAAVTGILLVSNVHFWLYTKVIHLEFLISFFLLLALVFFLAWKGRVSAAAAGILAALAVGTKFTSVFFLAPFVLSILVFFRGQWRRLAISALAGGLALVPILLSARSPEVRQLIFGAQIARPALDSAVRAKLLYGIFVQDPIFWMVVVAATSVIAGVFLRRFRISGETERVCVVILFSGALATALSVFIPRHFHDYYVLFQTPFLAIGIGLAVAIFPRSKHLAGAVAALILFLMFGFWQRFPPTGWRIPPIVEALRGRSRTLFAENPMMTRLAGRDPCPGYYFTDPQAIGLLDIQPERVWEDMEHCDEVLLDRRSADVGAVVVPYAVRTRLRENGELIYHDKRYRLYRLR